MIIWVNFSCFRILGKKLARANLPNVFSLVLNASCRQALTSFFTQRMYEVQALGLSGSLPLFVNAQSTNEAGLSIMYLVTTRTVAPLHGESVTDR